MLFHQPSVPLRAKNIWVELHNPCYISVGLDLSEKMAFWWEMTAGRLSNERNY
jgi:hypothetical protein